MGTNRFFTFFKVHHPLLRPTFLAAVIILYIDIIKELPLTLILGPSNHETLATKTYGLLTAEERIPEGSIPALFLISTSFIGIILISLILKRKNS